jgi:release factor glutamine methyltransferase
MNRPTIGEVVRSAQAKLARARIETASLDATLLMRYLLRVEKTEYLLRRHLPLPEGLEAPYAELIRRRIAGESVAYLIGKREFLALDFAVGPGALVPRPETELMVEWGAKWLHGRSQALAVDVGTGSGAIAIGIAHLASPHALRGVIAIEPSFEALRWARKNASTHAHNKPIAFVRGSLVSALAGPIDLVLANLPYLTPEQTDANSDLAVEPRSALVGGDDGLDLIRALIADLPRVLALDGAAILELDPSQADEVAALATATFDRAVVEIIPDLAGLARFVSIDRAPSPVRDVDA